MDNTKYNKGDWVRFYQNGTLIIGVIEYVNYDSFCYKWDLYTDKGSIREDDVLEVRHKDKE